MDQLTLGFSLLLKYLFLYTNTPDGVSCVYVMLYVHGVGVVNTSVLIGGLRAIHSPRPKGEGCIGGCSQS